MAAQQAEQLQDVSILTRSVENIFRNIVKLLVGKMSLVRLQALIREIFVQEAEAKLRTERPGRNVPLSRLALLTGLDTRTLIRVRGKISAKQASPQERTRISDINPESKIVELWMLNPEYCDPQTGKPRSLTFGEPGSEFETLAKAAITARGVTVQSILERLVVTNSVEIDHDNGLVKLVTERYSPFNSDHEMSLMMGGMQAITNITGTIQKNISSAKEERVIQREIWTFRLDPARHAEFRSVVRDFLLSVEMNADRVMSPLEAQYEKPDQLTAGVGFYYFEEDMAGA